MDLQQSSMLKTANPIRIVRFLRNKIIVSGIDAQVVVRIFLALTLLSLAVSVSLKSVFLVLSSAAIVLSFVIARRREMFEVVMTPWFFAATLFFVVIVLGCLMSPANQSTQLDFIHKYSKLFYLPLLVLGFQDKQSRFWAMHAFLLGMLITMGCSELKVLGLFKMHGEPSDFGEVFYNHIVTGYFMAFAAFLALIYAARAQGKWRAGYVLIALLLSYHTLFINQGRTGYVMLTVLILIFLIGCIRHRLSGLLILVPFVFLAYQSPLVHQGLSKVIGEAKNYQQGYQNSSLGYRLQFHQFAQNLFSRSPLIGVGTGAFSHYFSVEKPVPSWGTPLTGNTLLEPHGEYWLIAAEHGLVGLVAFFLLMISLSYEAYLTNEMRVIFVGLLMTFLVGCCNDGFLLLTGPGYFFVIFAAMSLGESFAKKQEKLARQSLLNKEY